MKKKEHVPTPDEIWKILKEVSLSQKETDRRMQESKAETDRLIRESKAETDRRMQESKAETDRLIRESKAETDRRMQETKAETDRLIRESKAETDRLIRESKAKNDQLIQASKAETERQIEENRLFIKQIDSRWGNHWGDLVEALIEGNFLQLLNERGIKVTKATPNYKGLRQNQIKEFDLVATNGQEMVVIETKSSLTKVKVDHFLEVMRHFKEYCSEFSTLTVYGGVACLKSTKDTLDYAEKKGLLVLRVSGQNAILENKESFKPKIFG